VGAVPNIEELAGILSCRISSFPMKYLGSRENEKKRLASCKKIYLSKGGRLTLIKTSLSNLPTYLLSLFPLPAGIAKHLERL
jgi:hypothetical protein